MRKFRLALALTLLTLLLSQTLTAANTSNIEAMTLSNTIHADDAEGEKKPEGDEEPDCD